MSKTDHGPAPERDWEAMYKALVAERAADLEVTVSLNMDLKKELAEVRRQLTQATAAGVNQISVIRSLSTSVETLSIALSNEIGISTNRER